MEQIKRNKQGRFEKESKPINGFKKGMIPWNKGLTAKNDIRVKLNTDKCHETNKKSFQDGRLTVWNKDKQWSKGVKAKMSQARLKGIASGKIKHWTENEEIKNRTIEKIKMANNEMYKNRIGKTFEELYGTEKALRIHNKRLGKLSEERKGSGNPMFGKKLEQAGNWHGGLSFEPYGIEFNDKLRKQIRARDKVCIICEISKEYKKQEIESQDLELWQKTVLKLNLEQRQTALHIHHIDYNKTNNQPSNLIALCANHHLMTNSNRIKWQNILKNIMKTKLNKIEIESDLVVTR